MVEGSKPKWQEELADEIRKRLPADDYPQLRKGALEVLKLS